MDLYSDGTQVGFLIGMYFMASAIVALTLVYFSRPKPKKQHSENKLEALVQTNAAGEESQSAHSENQSQVKTLNAPAVPEAVDKPPEPLEKKEELPLNKSKISDQAAPEKQESLSPGGINKGGDLKKNRPLITVTNAPKAQVESVPPVASAPEKQILEPAKTIDAKEEKRETSTIPAAPSNQAGNANSGKSDKEDKPKPASSTTDFSDLFTEDTEESEAGRLAKELSEIDAEDVLQTSLDLINQFKRNRG
jgi:hypothetical protein